MINLRRSFIVGIKGLHLTKKEFLFLKKYKPWGVILFSRNIKTIFQTQQLTKSIKTTFNDYNYPILIDEEGGRVSRLRNFIDNSIFTNDFFGKLYTNNHRKFEIYFDIYVKQISYLLTLLGINLNTVPVLDVRRNFTDKIIGDRSFSSKCIICEYFLIYFCYDDFFFPNNRYKEKVKVRAKAKVKAKAKAKVKAKAQAKAKAKVKA